MSPPRVELAAAPGDRVEHEITLKNRGSEALNVKTEFQDFVSGGESGEPLFVPEDQNPWSMSRWAKVNAAAFRLSPGEEATVRVTIDVPKDAEPGGHYCAALFGSESQSPKETVVQAKVGTLFLLTVSGELTASGSISLESPRLVQHGPIDFRVHFENTGNVHVKPQGVVEIDSLFGDTVTLPIPEENVLPDSTRLSEVQLADISAGIYFVTVKASYGPDNLALESDRKTLIVLPWSAVITGIGMIAILTLAVLGILYLVRRQRSRVAS